MSPNLRRGVIAAAALALAGTATGLLVARDDGAAPEPLPSPGPPLGPTALRYRLDARFAPIFFCDPDYYPVGSEEHERTNGIAWWARADRDGDEVATILARVRLPPEPGAADILRVYREHKRLTTIDLEPAGGGFGFKLRSGRELDAVQVTGTIARDGTIRVQRREPANTACPICLAAGTRIATPAGEMPVAQMRPGMQVLTADETGRPVAAVVLRTARRDLGSTLLLIRVVLDDGRSVVAAAAHPTAIGTALGALEPGDILDGSIVVMVEAVAAHDGVTYDLLPSGPTGVYWANGVPLGSTLVSR